MKIVISPDSYKESLPAHDVAVQIAAGFREIFPDAEYVILPVADGGEGTVQAMIAATGGKIVSLSVTGPLGEPVAACYGITGDGRTAVIEMASASGLMLVHPEQRNPMTTTTYGTGELVRAALDAGVSRIFLGLGGSATNDGGAGMLQALGMKLLDSGNLEIGFGGRALARLTLIEQGALDPRLKQVRIEAACDVENPLVGERGAAAVFGPQKGATPEMVMQLDTNLAHYAAVISRDVGCEVAMAPGAGAAGGMGAAVLAMGGRLRPGIDLVLEIIGFEAIARDADLIITGEGRIDSQTVCGKAPLGVARAAKRLGKPVIAIAGSLAVDAGIAYSHGIDAVFDIVPQPCSLEDALADAAANVRLASRNIAALVKLARDL